MHATCPLCERPAPLVPRRSGAPGFQFGAHLARGGLRECGGAGRVYRGTPGQRRELGEPTPAGP